MDELKNCCGTTCDKRVVVNHMQDIMACNARLSSENERLKHQINTLAHMVPHKRADDFYAEFKCKLVKLAIVVSTVAFVFYVVNK